jgi:hypothetical protein
MKNIIKLFVIPVLTLFPGLLVSAQNVGIGTTTPTYPLTVVSNGNGIVSKNGTVEVGTYVDAAEGWLQTYSNNPLFFSTDNGSPQMALLVNGNVGIGTTTPTSKLQVAGTIQATDVNAGNNITASNDIIAGGDVTANGGGVLYNTVAPAATNLKVYYRTAAFNVTNLAGHAETVEASVGIGGGFTNPPMVFVGDITTTGGTLGPLYHLQLITYGSTTGSFKIRILNNGDDPVTQNITYNVMCIGN